MLITLSFTAGPYVLILMFFFFNATATTEIYTLSLHDALPILSYPNYVDFRDRNRSFDGLAIYQMTRVRSEEHTSELQSRRDLVCRLLLEKKKGKPDIHVDRLVRTSHYHAVEPDVSHRVLPLAG